MGDEGLTVERLRAAIKRDLELLETEASRLAEMAHKARAVATTALVRLEKGHSVLDLPSVSAADLDMQASRVARRVDHLQAITEVAFLAEGGSL